MSATVAKLKTDGKIQQEVLQEMNWDTRVHAAEIGVAVDRGVVTLTGNVDSYAKKMAAQEAAHRVAGVLDVANDIQVKIPGNLARTDGEISHAIRRTLEWDVWVPDERIRSTVSDGWVTLEGTVDVLRERTDVERVIRALAGVRGVTNKILVVPAKVKALDVRDMIEKALERRAEREAERIRIEVADGKVILSGRVRSWAEKRAIVGAVLHAPGVNAVEEDLFVDPLF